MNWLTVSVSPESGGDVKVSGTTAVQYPSETSFAWNTPVELEALPAQGYRFDRWGGDLSGSENPDTVVMTCDKSVTAYFTPAPLIHEDISVDEALDMIRKGGVVLVDVREEGEYCSGHVPGALNYPWIAGVLETRYEELSKTTPILTVCRTGVRSDAAAAFLNSVGFQEVYSVLGGMVAWKGETEACGDTRLVYFAHVETRGAWETDLLVVNASREAMAGSIIGYDGDGEFVSRIDLDLPSWGRRKITVGAPGEGFDQPDRIRYAVLYTSSETVSAFEKLYIQGRYSAAVSAVSTPEVNGETLRIPHIASDADWATGIALVNTTTDPRTLSFRFNDGSPEKTLAMKPLEHITFRIRDLFSGRPQPGISGVDIGNAGGVVGMVLFVREKAKILSGILIKDDLAGTLLYPHVPLGSGWETGIVARNAATVPVTVEIHPYSESGDALPILTQNVEAGDRFLGIASLLDLPEETAWLRLAAPSPVLTGLELFTRGQAMAGFETTHIDRRSGVFPNIDSSSVAGIAVVNLEEEPASVTFTACNDDGWTVAEKTVTLGGYSRFVSYPAEIFGAGLFGATYIRYESDRLLAGFQLNVSADGRMLDALSGT